MPFSHGPVLAYVGDGQYVTTGTTEYIGGTDRIRIEDGFPTDLASVPRLLWALLPPCGVYERAAVLHDWLCVDLAEAHRARRAPLVSSRDTDGLFRRVMREAGVGFVVRWLMWAGVRWGALANPARRAGWWRDGPLVLAVSTITATAAGAATYGLDRAVHALAHLIF